ncbi:MAG: lysoplasmalogenase [Bacteroidota bacterium]
MRYFAPLTLLFFTVLGIEIFAESQHALLVDGGQALGTLDNYLLTIWITKPLLMPILLAIFLLNKGKLKSSEKRYFPIALVLSLFGDIFLMFESKDLFVFGLGSFLVGHLLFVLSFRDRIRAAKPSSMRKILTIIPFLAFVIGFLVFLHGHFSGNAEKEPFFIPVSVYATVIGLMGITAALRINGTSNRGFILVMLGALIFIASDSCIALDRFVFRVTETDLGMPYGSIIIMLTYGIAQYLLTIGTLKSNK